MYGKAIKFAINVNGNVQQKSTIKFRLYPSNYFSSVPTQPAKKESSLVDDIRRSASGMPPSPPSSSPSSSPPIDHRVNVVKTSTTPTTQSSSSSSFDDKRDVDSNHNYNNNGGDMSSYVADTAKQGVVKAVETGLEIGEMAKKTLDNVWDASKDTTNAIKDAVAGDDDHKANNNNDRFVDDLRRQHGRHGYDDLRKK